VLSDVFRVVQGVLSWLNSSSLTMSVHLNHHMLSLYSEHSMSPIPFIGFAVDSRNDSHHVSITPESIFTQSIDMSLSGLLDCHRLEFSI
jgi:hypothetical protein